ncbi:MAG: hypothetical protein AAGF27_05740 [Pseudomonadota bacterium]
MKRTILGGVLFLAPIAILAVLLGKAFHISRTVAEPIDAIVPIETVAGVASVNLIAIILIAVLCYIAGFLAQRAFIGRRMERLDGLLIDVIPTYAVFKGVVGSASSDEALSTLLTPVMVRFDDYEQMAFEIEADEKRSVIFLPGAPSAWAGSSVIVENERVTYLDVPTFEATRFLRAFGRGGLAARQRLLPKAEPLSAQVRPATP